MAEKVERVLVQGEASFRISCNDLMGLVTPEQAADERFMKRWFAEQAIKMISISSVETDYLYEDKVTISEETASRLTGTVISGNDWKDVQTENKA